MGERATAVLEVARWAAWVVGGMAVASLAREAAASAAAAWGASMAALAVAPKEWGSTVVMRRQRPA